MTFTSAKRIHWAAEGLMSWYASFLDVWVSSEDLVHEQYTTRFGCMVVLIGPGARPVLAVWLSR